MNLRFAMAMLLIGGPAAADPSTTVSADMHLGLAAAPFDVMGLPDAKGQALSVGLGGTWTVTPWLALDLRVPFAVASVAEPAGSYVDTTAFGNPQLGAIVPLMERVAAGVRLGIPLASHDDHLLANRALAIANGIDGLAHPELFAPGVVALTPFAAARWSSSPWSLVLEARIPILLRVHDADMPDAQTQTHSLGLAAVIAADLRRQLSQRLALALAPQLAIDVRPIAAHVRDVSRIQDLERASLSIAIGHRSQLAIDVQGSLAGELGGSTIALGARYELSLR